MAADRVNQKVRALEELAAVAQALRGKGQRVVLCHGVFDLLHLGHMRHFEAARRHGDVLIVTVTPDQYVAKGPGRPAFNQRLRAETIAALACVDYVAVNDWPTAVDTIRLLRPHVYAKGDDYRNRDADLTGGIHQEEAAVQDVGGEIVFTSEISFSSTELINQFYNVYPESARRFLDDFRSRHSADDIVGRLQALRDLKVLVVGEAIIDEYHYCLPVGKSPKEAIVSTRHVREEAHAGGALACANHIAGFCREVGIVTCLGETDTREAMIRRTLGPNVTPHFVVRPGAPTIVKRRYIWEPFLTKMFEIAFMDDRDLPRPVEDRLVDLLGDVLPQYDVVIVADYGHGFLGGRAATTLSERSRFVAVNTQVNSANMGFNLVTKYAHADYVCIDEPEIRLAMHDRWTAVPELAVKVRGLLSARAISVTRGHHGAFASSETEQAEVPVLSREVVDRVGAGDAYLAVTAPCVAAGYPMDVIGFIGNAVGALAVKIVGNRSPVEPVALFKYVTALLK
jgi:rfaE bifunctional protein nucleotidyltransferase chain/domain